MYLRTRRHTQTLFSIYSSPLLCLVELARLLPSSIFGSSHLLYDSGVTRLAVPTPSAARKETEQISRKGEREREACRRPGISESSKVQAHLTENLEYQPRTFLSDTCLPIFSYHPSLSPNKNTMASLTKKLSLRTNLSVCALLQS